MKYAYQAVERIPQQLQNDVVYHTEKFGLAAFLCACGCGHRITLLVPDSHQVVAEHGLTTIRPSIGVFDAACKSHYFITAGQVQWLPAFTAAQATSIMERQIARHVALETKRWSWRAWLRGAVIRAIYFLRSFFHIG